MLTLIFASLCFQERLEFVLPDERVYPGEVKCRLKTGFPEDDIVGISVSVNGRLSHYFETPPYEVTLDLRDFPDGPVTVTAELELFSGKTHSASVTGENRLPDYLENVKLVRVPVLLQQPSGSSYGIDDFAISEDGKPQKVELLFGEEKAIRLMVVLDLSGSMEKRLVSLRMAVSAFIDRLREGDSIQIVGFNHRVFEICPPETDFTVVKRRLGLLQAQGSTNLYGAVWSGLKTLGKANERRALILFTDGEHDLDGLEDIYKKDEVQCVDLARENGVPIYIVAFGNAVKPAVLADLSEATGGEAFFNKGPKSLRRAFEAIGDNLRHQYLLCYYTQSTLMGWHKIDVSLLADAAVELSYPKQLYFK